jgi:serine/threonine-protein kinase
MGAVYVVTHVNTGATLALKVMLDSVFLEQERGERFRREARAASLVQSDHVVRITDADFAPELGGAPFLVMELLEGENLEQKMEREGALSPEDTVTILRDVARALDKAHAAGVVHRDLKPENVFLQRRDDGTSLVKLLDFGISKILQEETLTSSTGGVILGTPLYMAPEQVRAGTPVGPATDVWSIGMIAVEMLTADSYWQAPTAFDLMMAIVSPERAAPSLRWPELGRAFDAWFFRSCAPAPEQRWARVGEQVKALADALHFDRAAPTVRDPLAISGESRASLESVPAVYGVDGVADTAAWTAASISPPRHPGDSASEVAVVLAPHQRRVAAPPSPQELEAARRARVRRRITAAVAVIAPLVGAVVGLRACYHATPSASVAAVVSGGASGGVTAGAAGPTDMPAPLSTLSPMPPDTALVAATTPPPDPALAASGLPPLVPVHASKTSERAFSRKNAATNASSAPSPSPPSTSSASPPPRDLFDTPN